MDKDMEKAVKIISDMVNDHGEITFIRVRIATALIEAREEGRRTGLEEGAKIAEDVCPDENYGDMCHESIAMRIRAAKERDNG